MDSSRNIITSGDNHICLNDEDWKIPYYLFMVDRFVTVDIRIVFDNSQKVTLVHLLYYLLLFSIVLKQHNNEVPIATKKLLFVSFGIA